MTSCDVQAESPVSRHSESAIVMLAVIAVIASAHLAAALLVPVLFAFLLYLLLFPLVRSLTRLRVPTPLAAAIVVGLLLSLVILALSSLAEPAERWLGEAPTTVRELQQRFFAAETRLAGIQELADEVEQLANSETKKRAQPVVIQKPGVLENLIGDLPKLMTFAGIVVFLTYFLLAAGDELLRRITRCGRTYAARRRIVSVAHNIQMEMTRYIGTITIVNTTLGVIVAVAMYVLEVPNPWLWGAVAAVFNFAPYAGAVATTSVLVIVGLTAFDNLTDSLSVPLAFLAITILEGQLITPSVLGRRMSLNPIVIFVSVIFWGWIWGIGGALMAVPIVMTIKIVCDHVPELNGAAILLRRDLNAVPKKDTRHNERAVLA